MIVMLTETSHDTPTSYSASSHKYMYTNIYVQTHNPTIPEVVAER